MKNRLNILSVTTLIVTVLQLTVLKAQNFDQLIKDHPDEKAVFLNRSLAYNISMKDGKPFVESHEVQQIQYLQGSATTFMTKCGFSHSDFQQLVSYQAYTRTPADKKVKVTEFTTSTNKESFVFYDDVKSTTFNFPDVEPGAIGNLEVSWINKDPHLLNPFYFTSYLPVINNELKIEVASDISLKYRLMGLDTDKIAVKVENNHRGKVYTFQYKNCPTEKSYPDAPGVEWYSPHVMFYIENYKGADGKVVSYLSNADDLYRLNYSYIKSVNKSLSPELKHVVDSLTANLTSPLSKAKSIYTWVQHNIKYLAFEDGMEGFIPREASLVYSRRFGDCKDMASILTQMINAAGVPAYFTWIGTRDLPYKFSEEPLPLVSNHMICAIKPDDKFIFLDGTDPTCVFGTPSAGIQDKEAMIAINENEYKIEKVSARDKESNLSIDTTWLELTPDGIKGRIKLDLHGYFATNTYARLMFVNEKDLNDDMKDDLIRGSNKFKLDTFNIDKKQTTDAISLNAGFSLPDYAKKIGNDYYLNLNLFKFFQGEQIDYPKRTMPISYEFKYQKKYVTMLKIPEGYKVSYIPQSKTYRNKLWGFDMQYQQKGNWVMLTQEFDNDKLILNNNEFADWNKVLENLLPLYKETLSLTKL